MSSTNLYLETVLTLATFSANVVFGFVLLFAAVIMPGLGALSDESFLQGFKAIDATIQANQPVFLSMWLGSLFMTLALTYLGRKSWATIAPRRLNLLYLSCGTMVLGHVFTVAGNIPLNNRVHGIDIENLDDQALSEERLAFESPWNVYNNARTVLFGIASVTLLIILLHYKREDSADKSTVTSQATEQLAPVGLGEGVNSNYQSIV